VNGSAAAGRECCEQEKCCERKSVLGERYYAGRMLLCWKSAGMLEERWYAGRALVCWKSAGMLEERWYAMLNAGPPAELLRGENFAASRE